MAPVPQNTDTNTSSTTLEQLKGYSPWRPVIFTVSADMNSATFGTVEILARGLDLREIKGAACEGQLFNQDWVGIRPFGPKVLGISLFPLE